MALPRKPAAPYVVGRGRPPLPNRWKKGISGNPKGRPPKKPDIGSEIHAVLKSRVRVGAKGEQVTMPMQEALVRALRRLALAGEITAQKILIKLHALTPEPVATWDPYEALMTSYAAQFIADELRADPALSEDPDDT